MKKPISVPVRGRGLLTVSELAEILRKRPAAVRALARRGEVAFYRVGRAMLFDPQDVETFLATCRRPARGERMLGMTVKRSGPG
jgi:excisionase family DNA binding protein